MDYQSIINSAQITDLDAENSEEETSNLEHTDEHLDSEFSPRNTLQSQFDAKPNTNESQTEVKQHEIECSLQTDENNKAVSLSETQNLMIEGSLVESRDEQKAEIELEMRETELQKTKNQYADELEREIGEAEREDRELSSSNDDEDGEENNDDSDLEMQQMKMQESIIEEPSGTESELAVNEKAISEEQKTNQIHSNLLIEEDDATINVEHRKSEKVKDQQNKEEESHAEIHEDSSSNESSELPLQMEEKYSEMERHEAASLHQSELENPAYSVEERQQSQSPQQSNSDSSIELEQHEEQQERQNEENEREGSEREHTKFKLHHNDRLDDHADDATLSSGTTDDEIAASFVHIDTPPEEMNEIDLNGGTEEVAETVEDARRRTSGEGNEVAGSSSLLSSIRNVFSGLSSPKQAVDVKPGNPPDSISSDAQASSSHVLSSDTTLSPPLTSSLSVSVSWCDPDQLSAANLKHVQLHLNCVSRLYERLLYDVRKLGNAIKEYLHAQLLLAECWNELGPQDAILEMDFQMPSDTMWLIVWNGRRLIEIVETFSSNLATFIKKTLADMQSSVSSLKRKQSVASFKLALFSFRSSPSINSGSADASTASSNIENTDIQVAEILTKLKFLEDNKYRLMQRQLLLMRNGMVAYFSGNQIELELTMKQFYVHDEFLPPGSGGVDVTGKYDVSPKSFNTASAISTSELSPNLNLDHQTNPPSTTLTTISTH